MSDDIVAAMETICTEEMLQQAFHVIRKPEQYLPVIPCPDCENCSAKYACKLTF